MKQFRLRINPIQCDGYGLCMDNFPERVRLDDWDYPIVDPTPFGEALLPGARRAVRACPRLAVIIDRVDGPGRRG